MFLIIDGYNLLKTFYKNSLEEDRDELLRLIENYRKDRQCKISVVFDGYNSYSLTTQETKFGGIKILYTGQHIKADKKIIHMVKQQGKGVVVITSDREVRNQVERLGATSFSSEDFLERLFLPDYKDEDEGIELEKKGNPRRLKKREREKLKRLKKL